MKFPITIDDDYQPDFLAKYQVIKTWNKEVTAAMNTTPAYNHLYWKDGTPNSINIEFTIPINKKVDF